MAGAVIESVSSKKLYTGLGAFLLITIGGFIIGGIFSSRPSAAINNIAIQCYDDHPEINRDNPNKWFMPWHPEDAPKVPQQNCTQLVDPAYIFMEPGMKSIKDVNVFNVVFAQHIPKNGEILTPWMSYLRILFFPTLKFHPKDDNEDIRNEPTDDRIHLVAKIGYRDELSENWKLLTESEFSRPYDCFFDEGRYDCEPMDFVELGSVPHKYYLINFRLPRDDKKSMNLHIGSIVDINMPVLYQPAKFTQIWLGLQTSTFMLQMATIIWFLQRLFALSREKTLIEKALVVVAIGMECANFPIQWIAFYINAPWMLLASDIRTGFVYFFLFSFWVIFISEHLLDRNDRNKLGNYYKELALIVLCTASMFVYDCVERGIQISKPFWSAEDTKLTETVSKAMPIIGAVTGSLYCIYLVYLVGTVLFNLIKRQSQFVGRLRHEDLIFRFQVVIYSTLACALISFIVFNYHQFTDEPELMISGHNFQIDASIQTGVYVMWNVYVTTLLILYAPSHKYHGRRAQSADSISTNSSNTGIRISENDALIETTSFNQRKDGIHTITYTEQSTADLLAPLTGPATKQD